MGAIWSGFFNFFKNQYGKKSITDEGVVVKNRAEKMIGDYLTKNKIRCIYEKEARWGWFIFKERISRPDFYLPDYNVYLEYWGLVEAENQREKEGMSK